MPVATRMEPMLPAQREDLENLAVSVYKASAKLSGQSLSEPTVKSLKILLRDVNSYYSNLIEGVRTTLADIKQGLRQVSVDAKTRRLQLLHKQNILAQNQIEAECLQNASNVTTLEFICRLHLLLFEGLPEEFLIQRTDNGSREACMVPGQLRSENVTVGGYMPPDAGDLHHLLARFGEVYALDKLSATTRLVAAAASHHRLLWIHPFLEGNGRVARLFTDAYLKCAGLDGYGLWTLSRGLARDQQRYKEYLAKADVPRQGDYDGRGALTERGLRNFCRYMLETALDQAAFMNKLLAVDAVPRNIVHYCRLRSEGNLAGQGPLPKHAAKILIHVFTFGTLGKGEVHDLIGTSDKTARGVVKILEAEGLLENESRNAPYTIGFPARAVEFIFPGLCDPGAFSESSL